MGFFFHVLRGHVHLSRYDANRHQNYHRLCATCGHSLFGQRSLCLHVPNKNDVSRLLVCQCVSSRCIAVTAANNNNNNNDQNMAADYDYSMKLTEYSSSGSNSSNSGSVGDGTATATSYIISGGNGSKADGNGKVGGRRRKGGKKQPRYDPFEMRDKSKATTYVLNTQ